MERVGTDESILTHRCASTTKTLRESVPNHTAAVELVLRVLIEGDESPVKDISSIKGVGHRVVHGGEKFSRSELITDDLIKVIEDVSDLAPLHNPPNLAGIKAAMGLLPNSPQVAVFDTAFHQSMAPEAFTYALPLEWYEKYKIRRYGFHGTSHLYVSQRAAALLKRPLSSLKLITLHIGNGASACAVLNGKSVDTSMGLTPLEGLVMGTRCGWIDPAIPIWMMGKEAIEPSDMDNILNKKSGILGITGKFMDRRDVIKNASKGDKRCKLALAIETRTLKKTIGSYAAAMGGVDCVVFTAGVGENSPAIRAGALEGLEFLGIHLDQRQNELAVGAKQEMIITKPDSRVKVAVIPTNEELVIAQDTLAIIEGKLDELLALHVP